MARRRDRRAPVDDLFAIAAKLPWWASLIIAFGSYLLLHHIASQDVGAVSSTKEIGAVAVRGLYRSLAFFGQFIVPPVFVLGAVAGLLGRKRGEALLAHVATAESTAALGAMSWQDFERLVREAFRLQGYSVQHRGGDGPDGGVDLVLTRGNEKTLVQCKQWRAMKVGVSVVRELFGVMAAQGAAAGIVVTSGSFTKDAVEFASGRNVRLIAGPELAGMIRRTTKAISESAGGKEEAQPATDGGAQACPRCGSPMVRRVATRGAKAGQAFLGCSRYPDCRATIDIV